jgi:hypothetical protein
VINLQTERGKMNVLKATSDDKPFTPEVEAPAIGATPGTTPGTTPAKPLQKVEQ